MPYIEHSFGRTWYTKRGAKRKGTPLIVLHGGPGSGHDSLTPYLALSSERPVFLYDQMGCGKSGDTPKNRWTVAAFVAELDHLVKAWGLSRFHLLGMSWGGTLALEYCLRRRSSRLRSLVLQSPMVSAADWQKDADRLVKSLPGGTRKVIRYCHEIGATDSAVYQQAMFEFYARHVLRNKTALRRRSPRTRGGEAIYQYMWGPSEFQVTGTLRNYDRTDALPQVRVPTLFVCGEYDESTPKTLRRYVAEMADAHLAVIPNASHVITQEKPAAVNRVVARFLREQNG